SRAQAGFPFAKLQAEVMHRSYEAGAAADALAPAPAETLTDWGGYSQLLWGFRRNWVAGLRGDWVAKSSGTWIDELGQERRYRVSPNLSFYPTEFSKLRLQYNHDWLERAGSRESVWLQLEFLLGAH